MLGGPWVFIAPALGFGLGFLGDWKLMHGRHGNGGSSGGGCHGVEHRHDREVERRTKRPRDKAIES